MLLLAFGVPTLIHCTGSKVHSLADTLFFN